MSDEERIERLTALAQCVWPDTRVIAWPEHVYVEDETPVQRASVFGHPQALDALEAALLVLSGEGKPITGGLSGPEALRLRTGYERLKHRAEVAEAKLEQVEQLASEWERTAGQLDDGDYAEGAHAAFERCTRELRERAKGRQ